MGFQVSCNARRHKVPKVAGDLFQSLMGFQVSCNPPKSPLQGRLERQFQSLMGFQVSCNVQDFKIRIGHSDVSIPNGFSS